MPIENRNLKPGIHLVGRYHKQSYSCEIIEGEGGKLRYRLEDGREFKSPSAAGMAITGHACDGWIFWSVETAQNASSAKAQIEVTNPPAEVAANITGVATRPETGNAPGPEESAALQATALTENTPTTAKKPFHRTPNQKGVMEGQTRWYCQTCGESFQAPYGEMPIACPQGHKAS